MSEIKPALTREEWEEWKTQNGVFGWRSGMGDGGELDSVSLHPNGDVTVVSLDADSVILDSSDRRMLAALCLHNQPFGFTREDVENAVAAADRLRGAAGYIVDTQGPNGIPASTRLHDRAAEYDHLAARIEALLPPEEDNG